MADVRLLELRNTYKWGGGPDKTILLSAARHNRERVSVVVAYIRDAHDREFCIAERARANGLTFYEIEERGKFDFRVLREIRDIVVRHNINVIHAHEYKTNLFAYLVRRWLWRRRIALLSTAHGWALTGFRGKLYQRLDLFFVRHFDHLIAVSHATKAAMVKAGVPADRVSVIHNAIDTEEWSPARAATTLREELGLGPAFPVIGYVGRLTPEKDLDVWLRAAALVAEKYPKARFLLIGDGRDGVMREQLEKLTVTLGLAHQVMFLGYRENLIPAYATFDLFLLTSRTEGLPNCVLEAMAMGIPVVTTGVGGAGELVVHGQTGFILRRGDVAGLAQTMLTLIGDDASRRRMGAAGRARVEHDFSFTRRLQRIEDLYEVLSGFRAPASLLPAANEHS